MSSDDITMYAYNHGDKTMHVCVCPDGTATTRAYPKQNDVCDGEVYEYECKAGRATLTHFRDDALQKALNVIVYCNS
jgi:hypothetical protein